MFIKTIKYQILIALTCACSHHREHLSSAHSNTVVKQINQFFNVYFTAVKERGLKAEFPYLDQSEDFFWIPPGYSAPISYDSVRSVLMLNASRYVSVENTLDTLRVFPLTYRTARYVAKLRSVMTDTSGQVTTVSLLESGVVVKRGDAWKLLSGQTMLLNP